MSRFSSPVCLVRLYLRLFSHFTSPRPCLFVQREIRAQRSAGNPDGLVRCSRVYPRPQSDCFSRCPKNSRPVSFNTLLFVSCLLELDSRTNDHSCHNTTRQAGRQAGSCPPAAPPATIMRDTLARSFSGRDRDGDKGRDTSLLLFSPLSPFPPVHFHFRVTLREQRRHRRRRPKCVLRSDAEEGKGEKGARSLALHFECLLATF